MDRFARTCEASHTLFNLNIRPFALHRRRINFPDWFSFASDAAHPLLQSSDAGWAASTSHRFKPANHVGV
jgi:hypothetical protein